VEFSNVEGSFGFALGSFSEFAVFELFENGIGGIWEIHYG